MPKLPTGVDRRPSGKYRVRTNIGGHRITRTVNTLAEARAVKAELGLTAPTRPGTVNELLDRWLAAKAGQIGDATLIDYRTVIELHLRPAIGNLEVSAIHPDNLNQIYRRLTDRGTSAARIRRIHQIASSAFQTAVSWGDIPKSPVAAASPPKIRRTEISPPTPEQVAQIITEAAETHPGLPMFLRLAVVTGARRGELVALRGDDINLETAELTIRRALTRADTNGQHHGTAVKGLTGIVEKDTKTHSARKLALDTTTITALKSHRRMLAERALSVGVCFDLEQHRWFTDDPAGQIPWRPEQVNRWYHRARTQAGLEHVRLHDLRHFAATQALAAGVDVRTVAGRLGHSRASMTLDRYSHVIPAADRAAADILGDIVSG